MTYQFLPFSKNSRVNHLLLFHLPKGDPSSFTPLGLRHLRALHFVGGNSLISLILFLLVSVSELWGEKAICSNGEGVYLFGIYCIGNDRREPDLSKPIDLEDSNEAHLSICENGFLLYFKIHPEVNDYAFREFFTKSEITKLSLLKDDTILFIEKSKPFVASFYLYRPEGFKGFGIEKLMTEIESRSCGD